MQLPIVVLIPTKSLEVLFGVSEGSGKLHGTFLMAIAMKYNASTIRVLENLIWHFSQRNCNIQTDVEKLYEVSEWSGIS